MIATVVETKELLQTVVASLVAGVGVTAAVSITIFGAVRFTDLRRNDRPLASGAAGLLAILALAVTAASIVFGIIVMTQKS
jgi:hypothetical protein